jgi:phosphatidylglycerol lysyltransferase
MHTLGGMERRDDLAEVRELVVSYGWNATAYQILNPGMERWFSAARDAVVGFVTYGGYRVVAGSPVCAHERLGAVIEEFEKDTYQQGLRSCYFAADERLAQELAQRGPLDRILLGAQPVWDPHDWPGILRGKASLRAQLNRARNKGVSAERWDRERAEAQPSLHRCLEEWLETRGLPPLHFLVEPETLGRLFDRRIYVAVQDGAGAGGRQVRGFLVASPIPLRGGWLIEQIIRGRDAPNGTSELLLDAAWRDLAASGSRYVTLGLSPLSQRSGIEFRVPQAWLRLVLGWVRAHGRRFYDFDGLDAFKAKFLPSSWEPIWAITSERRVGLGTLWAISGAFGSMSPPRLLLLALWRGVVKELRWLGRGLKA